MPAPRPTLPEMFAVVDESLGSLSTQLQGAALFEVRVLRRVLRAIAREVQHGATLERRERAHLAALLDVDGTLDELNLELCRRIRDGRVIYGQPRLLGLLRDHVQARLDIDNPSFKTEHLPPEDDREP